MVKRDIISVLDMKDDMPELVDLAIKLKKERGNLVVVEIERKKRANMDVLPKN